jgi:outer membrane protein assembly factor BamB
MIQARYPSRMAFVAVALGWLCAPASGAAGDVLTYHGRADRSGHYVVPALTWDRGRLLRLDGNFHAKVAGHVYAQPLHWHGSDAGPPVLIVATEDNVVQAVDARTGAEVWSRTLGRPVARSSLRCGNISPLGITGTPAIDEGKQAVYLDAAVAGPSGPRHLVFALSLKDGAILPGWPVDIGATLAGQHRPFVPADQNQRGALTILDGKVYVPFGGHFGDCGEYHGVVVGISLSNPTDVTSWATRARGGGIWAPGGLSSDGKSLFAATGNTFGASSYGDGEAVVRLAPNLHRSTDKRDFFAPSDWAALDRRDADLGGTNPLPLDVPAQGGTRALMLALGKDRKAYLLDRDDLGGIGGQLAEAIVAERSIITAPSVYPADDGVLVALQADGAQCPAANRGSGLVVLKIRAGPQPGVSTAWCGSARGAGAPIATTTDGHSNPIVWILGAEGDNRLHGFRGDTGEPLFTGPALSGLRHFQTLIATEDRLYVAADGTIYAFAF